MGYYVRAVKPKQKQVPESWRLQFVSHRRVHTSDSKAQKPKRTWNIPRTRWSSLGFQPKMTVAQARARAQQLNSRLHLKRQEERRLLLEQKASELQNRFNSAIPELYKVDFEQKYVFGRF